VVSFEFLRTAGSGSGSGSKDMSESENHRFRFFEEIGKSLVSGSLKKLENLWFPVL